MVRIKEFDSDPRVAAEPLGLPLRILTSAEAGFDPERATRELMGSEAPGVMQVSNVDDGGRFDIVHVRKPGQISASKLLVQGARLLVIEGAPEISRDAEIAADEVVQSGGPSVLVVTSGDAAARARVLFGLYAAIIHNQALDEAVKALDRAGVELYYAYGRGGESLLLLGHVWGALQAQFEELHDHAIAATTKLDDVLREHRPYVHTAQLERLQREIPSVRRLDHFGDELHEMRRDLDWRHEGGAALPMSRAMRHLGPAFESTLALKKSVEELSQRIREEAASGPRVVNANFIAEGKVLDPDEALRPATDYGLLVDVGPVWSTIPSIVTGSAAFPDRYLPSPREGGYRVRVVVVSDDFTPPLSSAEIFVPAGQGRSFPVVDGERAKGPGPVAIPLRSPEATELRNAHARCCLYYQGNLIQSGVLTALVAPATVSPRPAGHNELKIDFALSGALQDLELFGASEAEPRVAFNVTLNDDGAGGHRLVLNNSSDPMPAFTPYDPNGASGDLKESRDLLLNLFYERDDHYGATDKPALDAANGKELLQFKRDLFLLAILGRRLFHTAFRDVRPESESDDALSWQKRMQAALRSSAVIQIARTGPAQYVYPWSLLYAHGLTGNDANWRYCEVINKEWPNGRRTGLPADRCPYQQVPGDHDNTICPYGFWGLRHIVEQPLAVGRMKDGHFDLQNAATRIHGTGGAIRLAIATTTDEKLDAKSIADHLAQLEGESGVQFVADVAHSAEEALKVMQETELLYMLCHGEFDTVKNEAYLGIGPKDAGRDYRIYTTTFSEWGLREAPPNLDGWRSTRPLVMINGCHTSNLQPGDVLNFVSALSTVNAGGVVGTEVSVRLPVAIEVAKLFFERVLPKNGGASGMPVGQAMREVRWELANKGNLLGLAYTLFCLSNLEVVNDPSGH